MSGCGSWRGYPPENGGIAGGIQSVRNQMAHFIVFSTAANVDCSPADIPHVSEHIREGGRDYGEFDIRKQFSTGRQRRANRSSAGKDSRACICARLAKAAPQQDQVKLSLSAQVHALYHQGMSANQIAANLGIPVKSVSSYLPGSTPAAPAATPASTKAPAAAPAAAQSAPAIQPATK
jgi:hypothetical protein